MDIVRNFLPVYFLPDRPLIQYQSHTCQTNRRGIETLQRSLVVSKIEWGREENHFSRRKLDTLNLHFYRHTTTCHVSADRPPLSSFSSVSVRSDIYFHRHFCQCYLDIDMGVGRFIRHLEHFESDQTYRSIVRYLKNFNISSNKIFLVLILYSQMKRY